MDAWIESQIKGYRDRRREAGHLPDRLTEALVEAAAKASVLHNDHNASELKKITQTIDSAGFWGDDQEWRISTWFERSILESEFEGEKRYRVSVKCDGQDLEAWCPTIAKAYSVLKIYEQFIVAQFYSVGPPWADNGEL